MFYGKIRQRKKILGNNLLGEYSRSLRIFSGVYSRLTSLRVHPLKPHLFERFVSILDHFSPGSALGKNFGFSYIFFCFMGSPISIPIFTLL